MKYNPKHWRRTSSYRKWKKQVLLKDNIKCVVCGKRKHLQAHHINSGKYFPELRYVVKNGITLCRFHHTLFHTSYMQSYRKKATYKDFCNFLEFFIKISDEVGYYDKDKLIKLKNQIERIKWTTYQ